MSDTYYCAGCGQRVYRGVTHSCIAPTFTIVDPIQNKSSYECECARMTKARELLAKAMYNMAQHDIARSVQLEINEFLEGNNACLHVPIE